MRDVLRYLADCRYIWMWGLLSGIAYAAVFGLYGIRWEAIWYPLLLAAAFGLFFLTLGFLRYRKRHRGLERLDPADGPCADYLPRAGSLTERDYQELVRKEEDANRLQKEKWDAARRDMNDYYAAWVHQIKAPIAVMKILLQQQDTRENRELSAELFRVEQYAEMALSYIRLGEGASDLVIRECDLDEIIRKTVRKYAGQFIRRKIRLVYDGTDMKALTDEKWLSFILEQLLSNAVKYTPEGTNYRAKTRFAKFFNLPELMLMFREVADIQTADMLKLPVPAVKYHNIKTKPSEIQTELVASLAKRAEKVRARLVEPNVVFCQVLFPEKSVEIPFFQQGIFPAFSGHYASLRMRACSIR